MTKIILLNGYAPDSFNTICKLLSVKDYHFNKRLIKTLERLPVENVSNTDELYESCKNDPNVIHKVIVDGNKITAYAGWNAKLKNVCYVRIEKYNERKPHELVMNDSGEENIRRFKTKLVDKKHNLWSKLMNE